MAHKSSGGKNIYHVCSWAKLNVLLECHKKWGHIQTHSCHLLPWQHTIYNINLIPRKDLKQKTENTSLFGNAVCHNTLHILSFYWCFFYRIKHVFAKSCFCTWDGSIQSVVDKWANCLNDSNSINPPHPHPCTLGHVYFWGGGLCTLSCLDQPQTTLWMAYPNTTVQNHSHHTADGYAYWVRAGAELCNVDEEIHQTSSSRK